MSDDRFALWGQTPAQSAAPRDLAEVQDVVRRAQGWAIVPWGGGTRQHVGYIPAQYDLALSTENLNVVTDYQPADLTVTAQAGVTLAQLQNILAEHGQWLPLDIAQPERQTIGGIVAARADSLRRLAFGSVRDSLLGVSVVNAGGEIVKGGGKVVKNVAGFDLPKLFTGSLGTLGAIVTATFRVYPREASASTVLLRSNDNDGLGALAVRLLATTLVPSAIDLTGTLGAAEQTLAIRFEGSAAACDDQVRELLALADPLGATSET
ncbi:MAG: FAD-binding oxidoreductase, partial [Armatimonadota bacterium]|nr:FAD-binding oxidoreductase [Armatimonadota bacterium]